MPYPLKRYPGKFEGCDSPWVGEILYRSEYDDCFGDANEYGFYSGYIKGKRYTFFCTEDSQGFFDYRVCKNGMEADEVMKLYEMDQSSYEDWLSIEEE